MPGNGLPQTVLEWEVEGIGRKGRHNEVYPQIIDFNAKATRNVLRLRFLGFDAVYFRL
jgi:hypothetical protein